MKRMLNPKAFQVKHVWNCLKPKVFETKEKMFICVWNANLCYICQQWHNYYCRSKLFQKGMLGVIFRFICFLVPFCFIEAYRFMNYSENNMDEFFFS